MNVPALVSAGFIDGQTRRTDFNGTVLGSGSDKAVFVGVHFAYVDRECRRAI